MDEFISKLPDKKRLELIAVLKRSRVETTFSGPLPTPGDFKKYNEVLPNAADRILSMAEKEQEIRADGQAGILANDGKKIVGAIRIGMSMIAVAGLATWLDRGDIALPLGLSGTFTALFRLVMDWLERRQARMLSNN